LLVYAEQDRKPAQELIAAFSARLRAAGRHWDLQDYGDVPVGKRKDETKRQQKLNADLVLFFLSPELIVDLRSDQGFCADRPLIPLALRQIQEAHLQDTVLAGLSVFRDSEDRAWIQCQGHRKDDWAD